MKELTPNTVESSELVEQTFQFWFTGADHIRTPFPDYIRNDLKTMATDRFFNWASNLEDGAKDEMNDEMIGEKFEEIIFDVATSLVKTEDEKITILYPFLPRLEDSIKDQEGRNGIIVDRSIKKQEDKSFLEVKLIRDDGSDWVTQFELPV